MTDEEFNDMLSVSTFSLNPMSLIIWTLLAFNALFYFILFCIAVYFYYFWNPATASSHPSASEYAMITDDTSNSNVSEIQKLLAANPNILNDLAKLLDTNTQN